MAKSIPVAAEGRQIYTIELTEDFGALCGHLKALGYQRDQKVCIVTDSNVEPLYASEVQGFLQKEFDCVQIFAFEAGEHSKNLETVSRLYEFLILHHFDRRDFLVALGGGVVGDLTGFTAATYLRGIDFIQLPTTLLEFLILHHFDRRDFLVALGGGVVGDLTGFTAATYLRGIDFIQLPTTLLSQVDSSIGGKTGVDFLQYKNMVGAFCQPKLVYINLSVLKSLPRRQIISGMGEIVKHGLIRDAAYYRWLKENVSSIFLLDSAVTEEMVARSCRIKREVVEHDPTEKGERALLNFGHTIGHAIEKLCDFSLFHGECVGLGILSAAYLSMQCGHLTAEDVEDIRECLVSFGFSTSIGGIRPSDILAATKSDKKMVGDRVKFILLSEIGNAYIDRELTDTQLLDAISYVCLED